MQNVSKHCTGTDNLEMREKLSIILLFFSLYACAQKSKTFFIAQDTINQTDSLGLKQGYWAQLNDPIWDFAPYAGYLELKGWEGHYKNNKKIGKWKYYYGDNFDGCLRSGMWLTREENYYVNGDFCEEKLIGTTYKLCLNSDTTKGLFFLKPDTFQINCKNLECILSLYNKEVTKFKSKEIEIEIEKFLLGMYRRRIREIKE
jgi:hypothetical protein